MLTHLQIRDFAIIDAIELELRPGLTVLTGETGAGKSILVDALQLIAGGRAGAEVVRQSAARITTLARRAVHRRRRRTDHPPGHRHRRTLAGLSEWAVGSGPATARGRKHSHRHPRPTRISVADPQRSPARAAGCLWQARAPDLAGRNRAPGVVGARQPDRGAGGQGPRPGRATGAPAVPGPRVDGVASEGRRSGRPLRGAGATRQPRAPCRGGPDCVTPVVSR